MDIEKLLNIEIENAVLLIDEIHVLIDSRSGQKDINKVLSYFYLQSRKRNVHIFYTTQLSRLVDVRLRSITDLYIIAENMENCFKYTVYSGDIKVSTFYISRDKAKKYFKMYNTREIVKPRISVNMDKVMELYRKARDKDIFAELLKAEYPHISKTTGKTIFKMLKQGLKKEVEELISNLNPVV